ncbi:hypothetical protein [Devosia nitrariae]|uniref:Uncharacterized protein n=1 Tax=Devosia nitrariae TaxID=2071872 RepID=A0ABQ5W2T5_9HYPH|nr:hypothetical protein [Devosia nitrariae]GLQ54343.1 hypothetical protein GCM10010862_16020 [Devosia nitrariae]
MPSATPLLRSALFGLSLVLAAATPGLAAPVQDLPAASLDVKGALLVAQLDDIDFGDDSGQWANDGECDDPRFTGPGTADQLVDADLMKDATDCREAHEAGTVTLAGEESGTTAATDIDFGDDSGRWANDGECDDPRFTGPGTADELVDADRMHDATDCREAHEAGTVTLAGEKSETTATTDIDFGDDSSQWANDGECDDPRFAGPGTADELIETDRMHDATDCREAYEAGTVTLAGEKSDAAAPTDIDFGDDSSQWANDGECDDPRFAGTGMAAELLEADRMHDATDCRTLYEAGSITLKGDAVGIDDVDFGDDTSEWANDGECDDPRFTGTGMATTLLDEDRMHDATDCRTLFEDGSITLKGDAASIDDIDFGDDTSPWANDGECDDPRFTGPGTADQLLDSDELRDATDCREAFEAGTVTLAGTSSSAPAVFDYGDDSSQWANDGECDDPRFAGTGTGKKLLAEDEMRDATDCRTLVEAGEAEIRKVFDPAYAAAGPYDSSHIDFGDDSSTYANDGECDDPRFEGPGTATTLLDSDELRDASDCREAYEAGTIVQVGE